MQKKVFVSYSRQDIGLLRKVCQDLQRANLDLWTDETIEPGSESWTQAIEIAIESALALVVILTPNSKKSEHVKEEMNYAKHQGIRIIPVLAAGDERTSIPFGYSTRQWIDIRFDPDGQLNILINTLKKLTQRPPNSEGSPNNSPSDILDNISPTQEYSAPHSMDAYRIAERDNSPIMVFSDLVERINVRRTSRDVVPGPYPFYGATGIIDYINEFALDGDFLLVTRVGSSLVSRTSPIAFKASGRFSTNGNTYVLRPKREHVLLEYLLHYLSIADIRLYVGKGLAQPALAWRDLAEFPIVLPTLNEQQRRIKLAEEQIESIRLARAALAIQRTAVDEMETALLKQTIKGDELARVWWTVNLSSKLKETGARKWASTGSIRTSSNTRRCGWRKQAGSRFQNWNVT